MSSSGAQARMTSSVAGGAAGGAVVGGLVGGLVGAAIWAALGYFANVESGWVAWGVGGLTGLGVAVGGGRSGGTAAGTLAVLLALGAICLGKFAAVRLSLADFEGEIGKKLEAEIAQNHGNDDAFLLHVADSIAKEWSDAGHPPKWPNNKALEDREEESDYPPALIKEAKTRWAALDATEKENLKQSIEAHIRASVGSSMQAMRGEIASEGFMASWGILDVVFVGLAIMTSYRIASSGGAS